MLQCYALLILTCTPAPLACERQRPLPILSPSSIDPKVDGSQPDLIYDSDRQRVVLNFNLHRTGDWPHGGKNMQTTSSDFGATWTNPIELPASLGLRAAESGPGRALRLSRGAHKGRLIFSGWRNLQGGTPDGEVVWRSDDGGETFAAAPSFAGGYNEGQLAESNNGTVVIIFRVSAPGVQASHGRGLATSVDGGETFSNITLNPGLRSVACQVIQHTHTHTHTHIHTHTHTYTHTHTHT